MVNRSAPRRTSGQQNAWVSAIRTLGQNSSGMSAASVIVPARDAGDTVARTLAALAAQQFDDDYEVIVVDDGSRDQTYEIARAAPGPVTVLRQAPLGPAAARNLGVEHAGAPALAFCDADVYPTPRWLSAGLGALAGADIVQGKVLPDPSTPMAPFDRSIWILAQVGLWETANLFVRRQLFETVGGFEEWITPRHGKALAEDVWFGWRATRLAATAAYCPEALAYHAVFARSCREYVAEHWRRQYFPAMARKVPELRRTFLYRRVFLNARSARFDLALVGLALAARRRSPLALAAAVPYLRALASGSARAKSTGPPSLTVGAADAAADLVGLAAMIYGSARYRSVVL